MSSSSRTRKKTDPTSPRPTKPRGWQRLESVVMDRQNVDVTKLKKGAKPPQVLVTQLIDEDGAHWQREGDGPYEFIGWAPEAPET